MRTQARHIGEQATDDGLRVAKLRKYAQAVVDESYAPLDPATRAIIAALLSPATDDGAVPAA